LLKNLLKLSKIYEQKTCNTFVQFEDSNSIPNA
jgi:hypothetical protein